MRQIGRAYANLKSGIEWHLTLIDAELGESSGWRTDPAILRGILRRHNAAAREHAVAALRGDASADVGF